MLKSKLEKPVEIVAGPGETVSGARIIAFESGVRLVTGDIDRSGRHDEPLTTTFWEPYKARQIAYALLLAADAADRGKADIDELKRRESDRIKTLEDLRDTIQTTMRARRDAEEATADAKLELQNAMVIGDPDKIKSAKPEALIVEDVAPLLSDLTKRIEAADLQNYGNRAAVRAALEQITPGAIKRALNAFPGYTRFETTDGETND